MLIQTQEVAVIFYGKILYCPTNEIKNLTEHILNITSSQKVGEDLNSLRCQAANNLLTATRGSSTRE